MVRNKVELKCVLCVLLPPYCVVMYHDDELIVKLDFLNMNMWVFHKPSLPCGYRKLALVCGERKGEH